MADYDLAARLADAIAAVSAASVRLDRATVSTVSPFALVGSDGDIMAEAPGWYDPRQGDTVNVLRTGSSLVVLGPTAPPEVLRPPMTGKVTSVNTSSSTLGVLCGGTTYTLQYDSAYASPAVGHTVFVVWQEYERGSFQGFVAGRVGVYSPPPVVKPPTTPKPVEQPPPPPKTVVEVRDLPNPYRVKVVQAATWRGGGWRTDTTAIVSGDWTGRGDNCGYLFFGSGFDVLRGTIATSARLYLKAGSAGPGAKVASTIHMHGARKKGTSRPGLSETFTGPALADGEGGWGSMPLARAQQLINGDRSGLAIFDSGRSKYSTFPPISQVALQGTVEIAWREA